MVQSKVTCPACTGCTGVCRSIPLPSRGWVAFGVDECGIILHHFHAVAAGARVGVPGQGAGQGSASLL